MKRIILLFVAAALALSITSCTRILPLRFEKFVDKVEQNQDTYTDEQWDDILLQFDELEQKFEESRKKLTGEEIDRIENAEETFYTIYLKHRVNSAVNSVDENLHELAKKLKNGLKEGWDSLLENLFPEEE